MDRMRGYMAEVQIFQAASELIDKVSSFLILLAWIIWLIRENAILKTIIFRDLDEEKEAKREKKLAEEITSKFKQPTSTGI
jgi:hypothetical protein